MLAGHGDWRLPSRNELQLISGDDSTTQFSGNMAVGASGILHLTWAEKDPDTGVFQLLYRTYEPESAVWSEPQVLSSASA